MIKSLAINIINKKKLNIWSIVSLVAVILIIMPSFHIVANLFSQPNENWEHIKTYLLNKYFFNTAVIILFTGVLTMLIGSSLAWIVTIYDFPMKKFLKWGLMLPLAIPPYIAAYTYQGLLNYTGVIQTFLRNSFGMQVSQKYFNMMNMKGVIFVFTLFLFPYVYTITKSYLSRQTSSLIENARVLGKSSWQIFFKVVLPVSRGAIIGGVSLVLLEVLNDFGVVKYYGVPTFSTAIFKTWFAMGDVESAIRLSAILMAIVVGILVFERVARGRRKYSFTTTKIKPIAPIKLTGGKAVAVTSYVFGIFALGFLIPTVQLIHWTILSYERIFDIRFLQMSVASILVAGVTAVIIVFLAVFIANNNRIYDTLISKIYSKVTIVGYSIPGAVIAIGVIVFFINIDRSLKGFYQWINPKLGTLVLSTSIIMLIFAYVIRFLAIGFNSVEAGFDKIGKKFFEASRMLGKSPEKTFIQVDLPMLKPAIVGGFLLVFVDTLKELPLTLLLRPFNFNTLATKSFEYANDEMIHEAAISSLLIILISLGAVYLMNKISEKEA